MMPRLTARKGEPRDESGSGYFLLAVSLMNGTTEVDEVSGHIKATWRKRMKFGIATCARVRNVAQFRRRDFTEDHRCCLSRNRGRVRGCEVRFAQRPSENRARGFARATWRRVFAIVNAPPCGAYRAPFRLPPLCHRFGVDDLRRRCNDTRGQKPEKPREAGAAAVAAVAAASSWSTDSTPPSLVLSLVKHGSCGVVSATDRINPFLDTLLARSLARSRARNSFRSSLAAHVHYHRRRSAEAQPSGSRNGQVLLIRESPIKRHPRVKYP